MIAGFLNAVVSADTNQFDAGLDKAGKKVTTFKAAIDKESPKIGEAFRNMGNVSGFNQIAGGPINQLMGAFNDVKSIAAPLASSIGIVAGSLIGMGAAAVGAGVALAFMANSGAAKMGELTQSALRLGSTVESLSKMSAGSIDSGQFEHAMFHMQRSVESGGEHINLALGKIGLSSEQLKSMDATEQLRTVAGAFSTITSAGERAQLTMALFGRGGLGMVDILARGTAGLDAVAARSERFGLTFSTSQADALRKANIEWKGFGLAIQGISQQAAVMFTPVWAAIGKGGGIVGEMLVNGFRDAVPFMEDFGGKAGAILEPLWTGAMNVGETLAQMFRSALPLMGQIGSFAVTFGQMLLAPFQGFFSKFSGLGMNVAEVFQVGVTWVKIYLEVLTQIYTVAADVFKTIGAFMWDLTVKPWLDALAYWLGEFRVGWGDMQNIALTTMAVIKVSFQDLGVAGRLLYGLLQIGWLQLTKVMGESWAAVMNAIIPEFIRRFQYLIRTALAGFEAIAALDPTGKMTQAINDAKAAMGPITLATVLGRFDSSAIDGQISRIATSLGTEFMDFDGKVKGQVATWTQELNTSLRAAFRDTVPTAAALTAAMAPSGMAKAVSGHEAVSMGSDKAFSLLYGGQGTQEFYARQTADSSMRTANGIDRLIRDIASAPILRRATR